MKKKLIVLITSIFIITGCSSTNLTNKSIEELTDVMLNKETNLFNNIFDGYKYYIPRGLRLITKDEYNASIQDEYNNAYYLYIDVISYYNKEKIDYKQNKKAYYSKKISYNNKEGYIEITKIDDIDIYFVEYMYNYGKIEAFVDKNNINNAIINMSSILSSLKFNRTVLKTIVGNNVLDYKEDVYDVTKPKGSKATKDTYLEYEEKYGIYEGYGYHNSEEEKIEIKEK